MISVDELFEAINDRCGAVGPESPPESEVLSRWTSLLQTLRPSDIDVCVQAVSRLETERRDWTFEDNPWASCLVDCLKFAALARPLQFFSTVAKCGSSLVREASIRIACDVDGELGMAWIRALLEDPDTSEREQELIRTLL